MKKKEAIKRNTFRTKYSGKFEIRSHTLQLNRRTETEDKGNAPIKKDKKTG